MAEVVSPQLPLSQLGSKKDPNTADYPSLEMDDSEAASPNDAFIFPPPSALSLAPSSRHLRNRSTAAAAAHRRKPSNLSISALPPFEFGVSTNEASPRPLPSPTRSPARLTPPGHLSGHRRGGSEFVGGDITHGGPVMVNTSSTQDENSVAAPSSPVKGPSASRVRHSHKRSGAVSHSDIKLIMKPSSEPRADSAPQTPSLPCLPQRPPGPERSSSFPGPGKSPNSSNEISRRTLHSDSGEIRPRVGFSDHLEIIPRPLSTISSETSSSMSTVRAHHSVCESVGSSMHSETWSPPSNRAKSPSDVDSSLETNTAFATMLDQGCASDDSLRERSVSPKSQPVAQRLASDNRLQQEISTFSEDLPKASQPGATGSDPFNAENMPSIDQDPNSCVGRYAHNSFLKDHPRPRTSPESKPSKRQQKVKSWADNILHRRDRQPVKDFNHADQNLSSASDPLHESDFSLDNIDFDDDTTMIIEEPDFSPSGPSTTEFHQKAETSGTSLEHTSPSPMIDLDAALDSLGSPRNDSAFDDFHKFPGGKRRLHSSGETGGFTGPGMHYHRRADSAPEMEAFERSRYGFPRLGSNAAMEEAIEEEEEDTDQDSKRAENQVWGLGVNVVDCEATDHQPMRRRTSKHSAVEAHEQELERTVTGEIKVLEAVEVVEAEEEPRFSLVTKSSDESTITPTHSPGPLLSRPAPAPLESAIQTPSLSYGTTPETPSAVSSADYRKTLFDIHEPHIRTASSSVTGMTLDSSKGGDPGTMSVDDVPSLTSSASTMLSGQPNRHSSSGNTFSSADRPASISAAVPPRTRPHSSSKRSSLASLSKLVGGPYNKSKLNIEETLTPDAPDKTTKKRHRISRVMRFWKSKDKPSPG